MKHRDVKSLVQGYIAKNFDASLEQRLSWTTGASGASDGTEAEVLALLSLVGTSVG